VRTSKGLFRSGPVLALQLALLAGPSGLPSVLHPFDDVEKSTPSGVAPVASSIASGVDKELHCPICHLIRDARWSLLASRHAIAGMDLNGGRLVCAPLTLIDGSAPPTTGRSPPPV
jgi:hypothetical protein